MCFREKENVTMWSAEWFVLLPLPCKMVSRSLARSQCSQHLTILITISVAQKQYLLCEERKCC